MFTAENMALHAELLKTAEEKIALDPGVAKMLLSGVAGGAAVGVPGYLLMQHQAEKAKSRAQNQSFGAGLATGVAAPHVLRGVLNIAQQNGLISPQGSTP